MLIELCYILTKYQLLLLKRLQRDYDLISKLPIEKSEREAAFHKRCIQAALANTMTKITRFIHIMSQYVSDGTCFCSLSQKMTCFKQYLELYDFIFHFFLHISQGTFLRKQTECRHPEIQNLSFFGISQSSSLVGHN